jgi:hypothetical protein
MAVLSSILTSWHLGSGPVVPEARDYPGLGEEERRGRGGSESFRDLQKFGVGGSEIDFASLCSSLGSRSNIDIPWS